MTTNVKALTILYRTELARLAPKVSGDMALHQRSIEWLAKIVEARRPSIVLELGAGLSTVILADACAEVGASLYTYDHDAKWLASVRQLLKKLAAERHLRRGDHYWLDRTGLVAAAESNAWQPDLTLVDHGPSNTERLADLPMIVKASAPGALILLDDCRRTTAYEREASKVLAKLGLQLTRSVESTAHDNRWLGVVQMP